MIELAPTATPSSVASVSRRGPHGLGYGAVAVVGVSLLASLVFCTVDVCRA